MTVDDLRAMLADLMAGDPARRFAIVQEGNEDDPPDERWAIHGARFDDERRQLVLENWER